MSAVSVAGAVLVSMLALPAPAHAAPFNVEQLMQTLAQRGPETARFVEKRYLAVLDNKPVESSGELRYVPPDRMEKRTLKPKPEALLLTGDQIVVERGTLKHTLRLSDYPDIAPFVESIRATLSGDRKALERVYRIELHGNLERWSLVMLPSDAKLSTIVQRIDVTGSRDAVRSIAILQGDGDRSVMTIERTGSAAGASPPKSPPR